MAPSARVTSVSLALLAAAMLAGAFAFEHIGKLVPCVLCWWQRYAWMAALAFAVVARLGAGTRTGVALLALAALATLAGAGTALFHVGVEQAWWEGTAECGTPFGGEMTVEERLKALLGQPVTRCDQVAWSMLGISMAGWNGLIALVAGGLALMVALRQMMDRTS